VLRQLLTPKQFILGAVLIIAALILYFFLSAFMPLILAFFSALLLEPLVRLMQKYFRFKSRFPAVTIVFILFICFIAVTVYISITKLINEALAFIERLPYYIIEVTFFIENMFDQLNAAMAGLPPGMISELENQIDSQLRNLYEQGDNLTEQAITTLASAAQAIPNLVLVTLIFLIALFLISLDLPRYINGFYAQFKDENAEKVRFMFQRLAKVFTGFFKAQFLVSIIIFVVSYIGLLMISPRNALLMAIIIWIIDFIPIIGSIAILGPWGLFALIAGDTGTGIQLLILAAVLLIIRRTVEPKVMGDQIGLPPLPTLIGLYLGFYFFNLIGLILGPLLIIAFLSAREAGIIRFDLKI
jgi:sporulation integral membrane protein YtvI